MNSRPTLSSFGSVLLGLCMVCRYLRVYIHVLKIWKVCNLVMCLNLNVEDLFSLV